MSNEQVLYLDERLVYTGYIRIENREQYLTKVPLLHPADPRYALFWSRETRRCVEGLWGQMFGGWRYMRGNLYYYGNYTLLQETDRNKITRYIRPSIDDIEWEFSYGMAEARGFSGFVDDDEVTCLIPVREGASEEYLRGFFPHAFNSQGKVKRFIEPRDYIRRLHPRPLGRALYENETWNFGVLGSRGGGKALSLDSLLYTASGPMRIGDVKTGDEVYGHDGKLTIVTGVFPQGRVKMYRVTLRDGRTVECCENHLWKVYDSRKNRYIVVRTKDLLADYSRQREDKRYELKHKECFYSIQTCDAVQYPESELPIDPYTLGVLIGDGCFRSKLGNCISFTCANIDKELICEEIRKGLPDHIRFVSFSRNDISEVRLSSRKGDSWRSMRSTLKGLDLDQRKSQDKFIPREYLYASVEQRLRLLQGLMDTDGSVHGHHKEFCTSSPRLAKDVCELIRSLGITCRMSVKKTTHLDAFRILLYTDRQDIFTLPRKRDRVIPFTSAYSKSKAQRTAITDICAIEDADALCITVDNDEHLFLTDGYTVTHNSYYFALGEIEHGLIFDGASEYSQEFLDNKLTAEFCIGASMSDKSAEACTKIKASIEAKADPSRGRQFGVWGKDRDDVEYAPCPFYRSFSGTLDCPNKKNPFQYLYKKDRNGQWTSEGTMTKLNHVNYSAKKSDGAQAASGGRYLVSEIEEWGLVENCIDVHNANDSTVAREGVRFGVEAYLGTSGNLLKVQDAKKMFLNPLDYRILPYRNMHGNEGQDGYIGFFLSAMLTLRQYKDKDGNTKWPEVVEHMRKIRERKKQSKDPRSLRDEKMNRPCFVDEMWLSLEGNIMPVAELLRRKKDLMAHNMYRTLETPVRLIWDSKKDLGVDYEILHDAEPYRDWPVDFSKRKNPNGCVVLYDLPRYLNGFIPPDLYCFVGHDPYVEEDLERGGSIGATYILINPKYITFGVPGNIIAASYIDKPANGLDEYYETQEKLLALYGNPPQGLWYEKNRGQDCRAHYIRKNKIHLLAPTPQHAQGAAAYERGLSSYGYMVGNRIVKAQLATMVANWLIEETELPTDGRKKNLERLPCLFLINQMIEYDLDKNLDAFDGFRGCIVGLRNYEVRNASPNPEVVQKKKDMFKAFTHNPKIFKHARRLSQAQGFRR